MSHDTECLESATTIPDWDDELDEILDSLPLEDLDELLEILNAPLETCAVTSFAADPGVRCGLRKPVYIVPANTRRRDTWSNLLVYDFN